MPQEKDKELIVPLPNYVIEVKQDRNREWICSKMRVQGKTIKEIEVRLGAAQKAIVKKLRRLNGE